MPVRSAIAFALFLLLTAAPALAQPVVNTTQVDVDGRQVLILGRGFGPNPRVFYDRHPRLSAVHGAIECPASSACEWTASCPIGFVVLSAGHRWTNVTGNDLLNGNVPTSIADTDRIWRFVVTNLNAFGAELSDTLVCALRRRRWPAGAVFARA